MGRKGKGKGGGGGAPTQPQSSTTPLQDQTPGQRGGQYPAEGQEQNAGQGRGQNPGPRGRQNPGQAQTQNPGQGSGQHPGPRGGQNPGQAQTQNPGQGPGQHPGPRGGHNPGQGPGQNSGQAFGHNPGQGRGQNPSQVVQGGRGRGRGRGGGAGGFNAPGQQGPPGFVQGPRPASSPVWGPQSNASPSPASMPPPVAQAPIQAPPPSWGQPTPQQSQAPRQPSSAPGGQSTPHQGQQPRQMAPAKAAGDAQSTPRSVQPRGAQAGKSSQAVVLPRRVDCPNEPKSGRQIVLEVNHLLLKIADPGVKIYHYDVSIDPDKPKRFLRLVMDEMQRKCYPQNFPGFDGSKNLYSKGPLPFKDEITEEVNVPDSERQDKKLKTFKVTIKLARNNISLQELFAYQQKGKSTSIPQDVVQAVDVILRSASAQKFVQVGRSFFCPPMTPRDLGNGMELWYGFFQSFVMGSKPYLNIDVAHKGFPKSQPLLSLLKAMDPRAEKPSDALRYKRNEFERFIKGLKVEYQLPNVETSKRTYRVNGLVRNAFDERFQLDDSGRTMSIGEYFEKEKKYTLRYPDLPCVHVGHRDKTIYVPMELCVLSPGQATMKKLDETQTAAMVRIAATNVQDRKNKIKEAMQRANLNSSPHVKELGLSVATEFAKINGRILPAPKLAYYQDRTVQPARGVWRMDGMQFRETRELDKWICLVINSRVRPDDIRSFTENLRSEAKRVNMVMAAPAPPVIMDVRDQRKIMGELSNRLGKFRQEGHKLVLVVISGYNKQIYGQVKQVAELQVGVLTQCVKDETVTRRNNQATVHNIMLKINAKFNGVNQVIADQSKVKCFNSKVLVFGADVTHPSPDSKDIPSVAAVTASHDIKGFKYNMRVRLQAPRQEMIEDLAAIVYEQLAIYKKETGFLPEHIVFYRDGVSEGQFHEVISKEVTAIFRACEQLRTKPKLTFLVVQKRHHTRFFPTDNRDSQDKNGNVPAGTIVDTEITHASEIDFYLVSHASIQGVARPTKYHVLWDDAHMSENDIQLMTYNLCHLFTRCDRAVSYPAPTYYAHLAASRGRVYLEGKNVRIEDKKDWVKESSIIQTAMNFTNTSPMYFV